MKILTVAIPCYNSEEYMEKCINSILPVGEAVEILIVDDGSTKDRTGQIADSYAARYPSIVRAVHQENGGHGEAVNAGLRSATGLYYKVVDSDDWVNTKGLSKIVRAMQELEKEGGVDLLLANFVYDKVGAKHKRLMRFKNVFPQDRVFGWDEMHKMHQTQYILMHNIFYRTQMLRDSGLELPKHTFYVDNIFAFQPLPHVKRLYYMDVNLYHYFIGREDQSVNEKVMIGRIDQQILVNKIMIDVIAAEDFSDKSEAVKKYMLNYLSKIMTVTSIMLILSGTEEALQKKEDIWEYLKEKDADVYRSLRNNLFGIFMNLPGRAGRKVSVGAYKAAQKFVGFN
ncbi:MAG: glycosyltransferase family 2 protein [Lachnospiraceae bacterium]|nr:glycosyltransferase family 2 protein [Lachnospiraceae bacterium]